MIDTFHPQKGYIIGSILFGIDANLPKEQVVSKLTTMFRLSAEEAVEWYKLVSDNKDAFLLPDNINPASVPEAILYFYIKKYVDPNAGCNRLKLKDASKHTRTYDVDCAYNGHKWVIEFDSSSQHYSEEAQETDIMKNKLAQKNDYQVIRMRDLEQNPSSLKKLPDCINLHVYFWQYGTIDQKYEHTDEKAIKEMLKHITGKDFDFDYCKDLPLIRLMPYYRWKS